MTLVKKSNRFQVKMICQVADCNTHHGSELTKGCTDFGKALCFGPNTRNRHQQLPACFLETSRLALQQPCSSDSSNNPAALKTLHPLITSSSVQVHGFHRSRSDIDGIVHGGSMNLEFKGYFLPNDFDQIAPSAVKESERLSHLLM
jgi:hypothetical protein